MLARLRDWATQPQYVYQHQWQPGDLIIWDNTGTMHRALPYAIDSGGSCIARSSRVKSRCSETRYRHAGGYQRRRVGADVGKHATIEHIGRVAETADRLGYHHMTCSEHIGLPSTETDRREPVTGIRSPHSGMCRRARPRSSSPP